MLSTHVTPAASNMGNSVLYLVRMYKGPGSYAEHSWHKNTYAGTHMRTFADVHARTCTCTHTHTHAHANTHSYKKMPMVAS